MAKMLRLLHIKRRSFALEVLLKGNSWKQAFKEDWRKRKAWQPRWEYVLE
ncbi:MAG: hypothetical protein AABY09_02740 [Nanoarchaeota archaeon]